MQTKRFFFFLAQMVLLSALSVLLASTPKIKTFKTQQDFESGEPAGVSINHQGEILLAPQIDELFKSELPFLWAGAVDSKGNIYVAGGNSGQVYRIDARGNSSLAFETDELQVYALAVDGKDNLFVASSPKGKVYKVPAKKTVTTEDAVFFDPEEIYVWSLAVDGKNNLYVATGESGNIYKVDKSGSGSLLYESGDAHVRKIILDSQGHVIAGTANKGIVLRLDATGKAFVLYDSPLVEITDLFEDKNGHIYAAATGDPQVQRRGQGRQPAQTAEPKQERDGGNHDEDLASLLQPVVTADRLTRERGELCRIAPDGRVRIFQTLQSERIYSIAGGRAGNILLGAGAKGRLYSMTPSGEVTLVTKLDEMQVTLLATDAGGRTFLGTSNTGKVYRLSERVNSEGTFVSKVIDTGVFSHWGAVNWEAEVAPHAGVVVHTRSGNTEEPDKTWSEWSRSYSKAAGQAIESPAARYLQVKAVLSSSDGRTTPLLRELSISYLQKNVAPIIKQVVVHRPNEYYPEASNNASASSHLGNGANNGKNGFRKTSFGRKSQRKGYRSVSWVVQDDNDDEQTFNLSYRGLDEKSWKPLVENFTGTVYSWDSELMPDGQYVVKLEAQDDRSNPPSMVLKTAKISQPFVVDNKGPRVSRITAKQAGGATVIAFSVQDEFNKVKSVEYGLNAEKWHLVYPVDGICDSKLETFEIRIDSKLTGENSIVIKALDSIDNIGYGKATIGL
ncbi:MAG: hypothetical protein ACE5IY_03740 [bacterium]